MCDITVVSMGYPMLIALSLLCLPCTTYRAQVDVKAKGDIQASSGMNPSTSGIGVDQSADVTMAYVGQQDAEQKMLGFHSSKAAEHGNESNDSSGTEAGFAASGGNPSHIKIANCGTREENARWIEDVDLLSVNPFMENWFSTDRDEMILQPEQIGHAYAFGGGYAKLVFWEGEPIVKNQRSSEETQFPRDPFPIRSDGLNGPHPKHHQCIKTLVGDSGHIFFSPPHSARWGQINTVKNYTWAKYSFQHKYIVLKPEGVATLYAAAPHVECPAEVRVSLPFEVTPHAVTLKGKQIDSSYVLSGGAMVTKEGGTQCTLHFEFVDKDSARKVSFVKDRPSVKSLDELYNPRVKPLHALFAKVGIRQEQDMNLYAVTGGTSIDTDRASYYSDNRIPQVVTFSAMTEIGTHATRDGKTAVLATACMPAPLPILNTQFSFDMETASAFALSSEKAFALHVCPYSSMWQQGLWWIPRATSGRETVMIGGWETDFQNHAKEAVLALVVASGGTAVTGAGGPTVGNNVAAWMALGARHLIALSAIHDGRAQSGGSFGAAVSWGGIIKAAHNLLRYAMDDVKEDDVYSRVTQFAKTPGTRVDLVFSCGVVRTNLIQQIQIVFGLLQQQANERYGNGAELILSHSTKEAALIQKKDDFPSSYGSLVQTLMKGNSLTVMDVQVCKNFAASVKWSLRLDLIADDSTIQVSGDDRRSFTAPRHTDTPPDTRLQKHGHSSKQSPPHTDTPPDTRLQTHASTHTDTPPDTRLQTHASRHKDTRQTGESAIARLAESKAKHNAVVSK